MLSTNKNKQKRNPDTRQPGNFKSYLKQRSYSLTTIQSNYTMLLDFLSWLDKQSMEAEQVQNRDILAYIKYKQKQEIEQITIQRYTNAIKLFYAFKVSTGVIKTNPATNIKIQGIKRKKLHYTFSAEELNKIYNSYQPEQIEKKGGRTDQEHLLIEKRNKVLLGLYVYQGVQTSEIIKMEVGNIKLREGLIEIPQTKRSNERTLQLEPHQVMDMYDYVLQVRKEILTINGQQTEQLFVSPKAGNKQSNYVFALMRELKRQNRLIKNAWQLRASVIVKWLRQYNLRQAQYRAGHRHISSTESYLLNETEGLAEEINQFHPLG